MPTEPPDDRRPRSTERPDAPGSEMAEIASMISHELRGPITTIKGLAATIARYRDRLPEEEQLEFLSMIERETDRLLEIADQVSLTLRLDAAALQPIPRAVHLADLVGQALEIADVADRQIERSFDASLEVRVDLELAARAIAFVVTNAHRFSPPGAPIVIRGTRAGDRVVLEVEDQGPGIPEDRREQVFGRFASWRPDGYEDRHGAGLGLFLSRGLLAACGGEIGVGAAPGGGTIVQIHLPLEG